MKNYDGSQSFIFFVMEGLRVMGGFNLLMGGFKKLDETMGEIQLPRFFET